MIWIVAELRSDRPETILLFLSFSKANKVINSETEARSVQKKSILLSSRFWRTICTCERLYHAGSSTNLSSCQWLHWVSLASKNHSALVDNLFLFNYVVIYRSRSVHHKQIYNEIIENIHILMNFFSSIPSPCDLGGLFGSNFSFSYPSVSAHSGRECDYHDSSIHMATGVYGCRWIPYANGFPFSIGFAVVVGT